MHAPSPTPPFRSSDAELLRERVRLSLDHAYRLQANTPLGWLVVLAMFWGRAALEPALWWVAASASVWCVIMLQLRGLKRQSANQPVQQTVQAIKELALLNGLVWGALAIAGFGHGTTLENLIIIVLGGVAAINGPARVFFVESFALMLAGIWLPQVLYAVWNFDDGTAGLFVACLSTLLSLLLFYMVRLSRLVNSNIAARIQNEAIAAELRRTLAAAQHQASTDALTGCANRRAVETFLERLRLDYRTEGTDFSVLTLDIDHFKMVNDEYGHPVGDALLKAFAHRVSIQLQPTDLLARVGGDEFVVLLTGRSAAEAWLMAERIRSAVSQRPLLTEPLLSATVSIGVAQHLPDAEPSFMSNSSDQALFAAKHAGRNRVVLGQFPH